MWSTGCARGASLHPWLQPCAPDGAKSRIRYDGWPVKLARVERGVSGVGGGRWLWERLGDWARS